jgi:signal transduction histidine kinase
MRFFSSIKGRVTLWYIFILAVALFFFGAVSYLILSQNINDSFDLSVTPYYMQVKVEGYTASGETDEDYDFKSVITYYLSREAVDRIKSSSASIDATDMPYGRLSLDQKAFITDAVSGAQSVSVYGRLSSAEPGTMEVLVVLQSVDDADEIMAAFMRVLYITTPLTLVVAGGLGFLLIWRALRPIDDITRAAEGLDVRSGNAAISVKSSDELGRLSAVLNRAFGDVQETVKREREITAETSHNLKAPLAVMKGEATLALRGGRSREEYEETLFSISDEIGRLSSTIDRLLKLERMEKDGGETDLLKEMDLKPFLDDVAEDIKVLCEDKSVDFKYETLPSEDAVLIKGNAGRLRELLFNLADNAVKYTPSGGSVTLKLDIRGGEALVSLRDTGEGIPARDIPHIFERFYRTGISGPHEEFPGAGLGLAFCRVVAVRHGGSIDVKSRRKKGSTFTLRLPLIEPSYHSLERTV